MRRAPLALAVLLACCGSNPSTPPDIEGPFTGATYRFAVDRLELPQTKQDLADDLDGDGIGDNALGRVVAALQVFTDLNQGIDDMLGSGALAPIVEITTDDPTLQNDPTVGVRFLGREGEDSDVMGASLKDGVLTSNRTRTTRHPASGQLDLPVYEHVGPLALFATGLEIDLTRNGAGFSGVLRGAFPMAGYRLPAYLGLVQMILANPSEFPALIQMVDWSRDGVISLDEFNHAGILEGVLAPDLQTTDGNGNWAPVVRGQHKDALSFGIGLRLVPCAPGSSCHAPPIHLCIDGVEDGDESDVDCGGSCLSCPGAASCRSATDCQSGRCEAGQCDAPSCTDGRRDGFETDLDCGWNCSPCANGLSCLVSQDCASRCCTGDFFSAGVCLPTDCSDGVQDGCESDIDCGGPCAACAAGKTCHTYLDCASHDCEGELFGSLGHCT